MPCSTTKLDAEIQAKQAAIGQASQREIGQAAAVRVRLAKLPDDDERRIGSGFGRNFRGFGQLAAHDESCRPAARTAGKDEVACQADPGSATGCRIRERPPGAPPHDLTMTGAIARRAALVEVENHGGAQHDRTGGAEGCRERAARSAFLLFDSRRAAGQIRWRR